MQRSFSRSLTLLLLSTFMMGLVAGCQSSKPADEPSKESNKEMTEPQKAIVGEHKKKDDQ